MTLYILFALVLVGAALILAHAFKEDRPTETPPTADLLTKGEKNGNQQRHESGSSSTDRIGEPSGASERGSRSQSGGNGSVGGPSKPPRGKGNAGKPRTRRKKGSVRDQR